MHTVLGPDASRKALPALSDSLNPNVWVYKFKHPSEVWALSVATHAEPGSGKLSLGGFRIAPRERTDDATFDVDREALGLAMGMEEKVYWSRTLGVGGPLARRDMSRIVGGKCVLHPTDEARVGHPRDFELLDWAIECFQELERDAGIFLTTGQDMGHGTMSDGKTGSLDYLSARFRGCVDADTSWPTAEGNYQVLAGMLRGCGLALPDAKVGLIGVGNIGWRVLHRVRDAGAEILAVEANPGRRKEIAELGIRVWGPEGKPEMLREPLDAVVVNAAARSLDAATVAACAANGRLAVVCGSENLAMPDPLGADELLNARKVYCPTELGGMMGYLTAVEEYLAKAEGVPFRIESMVKAAEQLEPLMFEATSRVRNSGFAIDFETEARAAH